MVITLVSSAVCRTAARKGGGARPSTLSVRKRRRGFTLIELLVVMSIIALLLAIAVPRYMGRLQSSKETVLRQTLSITREALDKFYADTGKYPDDLPALVTKKYLRSIPVDPITDSSTTWVIQPPDDADKGGVYDLHSGAEGNGRDGTPYKGW
jgi:general secretion pathway protein G